MAETIEVTIERLGARGDGIAKLDGRAVYAPYALPGERVRVRLEKPHNKRDDELRARLVAVATPSPDRIDAACRHFGTCGGCAIQHLAPAPYAKWKRGLITEALERRGLSGKAVEPLIAIAPGKRRRADLTALRRKDDLLLGFNARASHRVIDVAECPVLLPEIVNIFNPLRDVLRHLLTPGARAEVVINATETGLDLLLVTGIKLGVKGRERLARFAEESDLARLSRRHPDAPSPETIIERRKPLMAFGGVPLIPPPGAFIQASIEGEVSLVAAVIAGIGKARRIADLFCGSGTFALPLTMHAAIKDTYVHAVDGNTDAVAAVAAAARNAKLPRLTTEVRDLERRPLRADELDRYDAVVIDPPRAGAKPQAQALAQSRVPVVMAISCNPGTFARDAAILSQGGYRLDFVRPVDQFPWTPHLELAARFVRE